MIWRDVLNYSAEGTEGVDTFLSWALDRWLDSTVDWTKSTVPRLRSIRHRGDQGGARPRKGTGELRVKPRASSRESLGHELV